MSASLWSVGRSESSGAGSHWRHARNCIDCTSSEIVLSGVPSSKGGSEDVEKFINEDDASDVTVDEDEVREVLATAWKQKRQEISKERFRRGFGKPSKPTATSATRRFLSEVEELKLRTKCNRCEHVGHWAREVSAKIVARCQKEVGKEVHPGRKVNSFLYKKRVERRTSVTGAPETHHDSSISLRGTVRCWTGVADIVSNVVHCWKKHAS